MAEEKTYVFGDTTGNNGLLSLLGPLMQQRGIDPSVLLAMRNNEGGFGEGQDKGPDRMGMRHNPEEIEKIEKEAYECGFEDGYEKAMEEMESRSNYRSGYRSSYRMGQRGGGR